MIQIDDFEFFTEPTPSPYGPPSDLVGVSFTINGRQTKQYLVADQHVDHGKALPYLMANLLTKLQETLLKEVLKVKVLHDAPLYAADPDNRLLAALGVRILEYCAED